MAGLGEEFRAAREARHLSLSDVSEQIHIRAVYLQSIEDEDWSAIAAPVYVRGFIRTYARFLGLPGEQAVAVFNDSIGAGAKQHEASVASPRRPSMWLYVAGLAALILVGFVGYNYYVFQQQATPATTAAAVTGAAGKAAANAGAAAGSGAAAAGNMAGSAGSAAANAVATTGANAGNMSGTAGDAIGAGAAAVASAAPADGTATPAADAKKPRTLEVHVTQASWLLVKIDGAQKLEGIFPAGTTKEFHGNTVRIRAGNAGGVNLTVNGKELGSMGPSGAVVDRTIGLTTEE
jgi:cytoskeletal protein RodZ